MICDCCRRVFAHVHLTDLSTLVGNTGRAETHLCRNCHGYHRLGVSTWVCPTCGEVVESSTTRLILGEVETGTLAYFHAPCVGSAPTGWVTPEGLVKVKRIRALDEPAAKDALEVQLREPITGQMVDPTPDGPLGWTSELCDCDLRDRKWDPNSGRCRSCGRFFDDSRHPLHLDAARSRRVCRYCRKPASVGVPGQVFVRDPGRQHAHEQCIPGAELPS